MVFHNAHSNTRIYNGYTIYDIYYGIDIQLFINFICRLLVRGKGIKIETSGIIFKKTKNRKRLNIDDVQKLR